MNPKSQYAGVTYHNGQWRAAVTVGKRSAHPERPTQLFPLDQEDAAGAWVATTRAALHEKRRAYGEAPVARDGRPATTTTATTSMDADLHTFMPSRAGKTTANNERSHLRGALATVIDGVRVGTMHRDALTSQHLKLMIAQWQTAPSAGTVRRVRVAAYARDGVTFPAYERRAPVTSGKVVSAKTIRYRLLVLKAMFRFFRTPLTPFLELVKGDVPQPPQPMPIGVPIETVLAVAHNLARAAAPRALVHRYRTPELHAAAVARETLRRADRLKTYARYLVLASTAQRPCQLMRAERTDVTPLTIAAPTWLVREAKQEPAHTVELSDDMASAMAVFIAADAWGPYDVSTHARRVHAAGWPIGIRPNNARHSVVIDLLALDPDALAKIQALLGHKSPVTSQRFYAPLIANRATAALLKGRMAGAFKLREVR